MHDKLPSIPGLTCSICSRPVDLHFAKTDEEGHAIHEGCYLSKLGLSKSLGDSSNVMQGDHRQVWKQKAIPPEKRAARLR